MGHSLVQSLLRLNNTKQKNTAQVATSQVSANLVLFSCLLTIYAHNGVGPKCQENTRRKHFIFHTLTWWAPTVILSMYFC